VVNFFILKTSFNWQSIVVANTLLFIGLYDYYTFIIPDLGVLTLLIIAILNFELSHLMYALIIFLLTFYYWYHKKMGFGDVKLLTVLTFIIGFFIFPVLALSMFLLILFNLRKKVTKVPLGFYTMLSSFIFYFFRWLYYVI
jgi:Flp pilus assembly protein protease CpaA